MWTITVSKNGEYVETLKYGLLGYFRATVQKLEAAGYDCSIAFN